MIRQNKILLEGMGNRTLETKHIDISDTGNIRVLRSDSVPGDRLKGSLLYTNIGAYASSPYNIFNDITDNKTTLGTKVWVAKNSKISRDVLRDSGYKITLDPEKAFTRIIPVPKANEPYCCDILIADGNHVYMYQISRHSVAGTNLQDFHKQAVINYLEQAHSDESTIVSHTLWDENVTFVYLVQDEDYYKDILTERVSVDMYCYDNNVSYAPSTEISLDTLSIWSCLKEEAVLEKAIMLSDWRKYPLCVCAVLNNAQHSVYRSSTRGFNIVLDEIGYSGFYYGGPFHYRKGVIQADDWNLMQRWLLSKYGLGDNGGLIQRNKIKNKDELALLKCRYAVRPMFLEKDTDVSLLSADIKNNQ